MCVHLFCMCMYLSLSMYSVCVKFLGLGVFAFICLCVSLRVFVYLRVVSLCMPVFVFKCTSVCVKDSNCSTNYIGSQSREGSLQGRMLTLEALPHLSQPLWRLPCLQTQFLSDLSIR